MNPSHSVVAVCTLAALVLAGCRSEQKPQVPPRKVETAPREAAAAELALVAPLVKGGTLLNYKIDAITLVPGEGLVVSLVKPGAFLPDGGETDGGPGCDPQHPDEARLGLALSLVPDAGSPDALVKGPYAIRPRPVSVPQPEADRLAAAFADLVNVSAPIPDSLSGGIGPGQPH